MLLVLLHHLTPTAPQARPQSLPPFLRAHTATFLPQTEAKGDTRRVLLVLLPRCPPHAHSRGVIKGLVL